MASNKPKTPDYTYPALLPGASVDNTAAMTAAILTASTAGNGTVFVPDGVWYFLPQSNTNYVRARSNVRVLLAPGAVLKVQADAGDYLSLFYDAGAGVTNFSIEGGKIDQNAAANTTCSVTPGSANTSQFVLFVSGVASDVLVRNVRFDTCCGINTVWVAGGPGNRNIAVEGCYFRFKKTTTASTPGYDNSTVYLTGRDNAVNHNRFYSATYADVPGAPWEFHGGPAVAVGNVVSGYMVCCYLTAQYYIADQQDAASADIPVDYVVSGNVFTRMGSGISVLCATSASNAAPLIHGVVLSNNRIGILQAGTHHDTNSSFGVKIFNAYAEDAIRDVVVSDTSITFEPDSRSTSARWGSMASGEWAGLSLQGTYGLTNALLDNIVVRNAPWTGMLFGANGATSKMKRVTVRNCKFIDCGSNTNGVFRSGVEVTGVMTDCKIVDCEVLDTATGATLNGRDSFRLYPTSAPVRTLFDRNASVSAGSGALSGVYVSADAMLPFGANVGDANVTLKAGVNNRIQRFATNLTANRTATLDTTNAYPGATFRVIRTGLGSFTLDVGGLKTIPSATAAFVDVEYDASGGAWRLTGYGTL